ncbi:MAG: efflux RND transporter permease subunit [Firmicutes bacterium]|nr:efflux RND transporter permease subunit [Bacillota bacterium]
MKISELSIKRPVATLMIFLLILVLGTVSISRLNIDLFPKMTFPVAAVITSYEGAGPQEIENMITRPIEDVLGTVANVKNLSSTSSAGQSVVVVEFDWGTDMDFALLDIREKIDMVESFLPEDAEKPMVVKFDPSLQPMMYLAVSGIDDLAELKRVAEDEIKPRIERVEGVASVSVSGGQTRIIEVDVDQEKLNAYGLSLQSIVQTLQAENLNLPGGEVRSGNLKLQVRTTGEFTDVNQIANLNILSPSGAVVKLKEVAQVSDTFDDDDGYVYLDGKTAVRLSINKETDANTVEVSKAVLKEIAKIRKDLPGAISFEVVSNDAKFIQQSIDSLKDSAIYGGLLALLILLLFLRNVTSTLIVGIAIPISVITTFVLVYFAGLDLNMMTLGGLALGVGMLVDNSIVVLENIYRYRQQGYSMLEAAKEGSSEVGMAIVASTLTTVVVFLPIVFTSGLTSQLFKEMALTVTFSLLASLFVALTLVPMLSSKFLTLHKGEPKRDVSEGAESAETEKKGVKYWYTCLLEWCLLHRRTTIVLVTLMFVGSMALVPKIGAEFMPKADFSMIQVNVKMPKGTVLEKTEEVAGTIDSILAQVPEIESVFATVGAQDNFGLTSGNSSDRASYLISLSDKDKRQRSDVEIAEWIRQRVSKIPGAEISVNALTMTSMMGEGGKPVSVKIKGPDLETLYQISDDVVEIVKGVEGTREVESSLDSGRPELQVHIDRDRAAALGLNAYTIASQVRTAVEGTTATRYKVDGREYDVIVQLARDGTASVDRLGQLMITSPTGVRVPLKEVAQLVLEEGPNFITRENQERVVEISADIIGADLRTVTQEIKKRLDRYPLPPQYSYSMGGQSKEMANSFQDLFLALVLAIVFVYMILAAQFESLVHPFTIMMAVPLAFIGVVWGLFLSGKLFSTVSIIGIIMLAGIVVNNSIVLVDYTNQLRRKGLSAVEALKKAGPVRLRPIFMTALTTILALLPMSLGFGEGAELRSPLAVVVIGGLTVATFLTLVVVPVIYASLDSLGQKIRRLFQRKNQPAVGSQA